MTDFGNLFSCPQFEGGSATKEEKAEGGALRIEEAAAAPGAAAPAAAEPVVDNGKGKAPMPAPEEENEEEAAAAAAAAIAAAAAGEAADDDDDGPAEEEEEEKTDMELAWENLETARHIYESNLDSMTSDQKLMFAGDSAYLPLCILLGALRLLSPPFAPSPLLLPHSASSLSSLPLLFLPLCFLLLSLSLLDPAPSLILSCFC